MTVHSVSHGGRPGRTCSNGDPTVRRDHGDGVPKEGFKGEKLGRSQKKMNPETKEKLCRAINSLGKGKLEQILLPNELKEVETLDQDYVEKLIKEPCEPT